MSEPRKTFGIPPEALHTIGLDAGSIAKTVTKAMQERARRKQLPLATVNELATTLRIDRATVYRLPIPYVLVGSRRRYRPEDVHAYLESRKVNP